MSAFLRSELGVVCPSCDAHNAARSSECLACRAGLGASGAPPARTSSSIATAAAQWDADALEVDTLDLEPERPTGMTPVPPGMKPSRHTPAPGESAASAPPGALPQRPVVTPVAGLPSAFRPATPTASPAVTASPTAPPVPEAAPPGPAPRTPPSVPVTAVPRMPTPSGPIQQVPVLTPPGGASGAPRPVTTGPRYGLSVVQGKARGARFRLPPSGATIGTGRTALMLEDPFVSAHHATLLVREGVLYVRDEASTSGTLVGIHELEVLPPGTAFAAGPRLFRYGGTVVPPVPVSGQPTPYGAPVTPGQPVYLVEELLLGGRPGRAVALAGPIISFGYGPCDFSVPQEEGLAPRHCELVPGPAAAHLRDLSGGLGTYVRLAPRTERALRVGDRLRFGQHLIQVEAPI